MRKRRAARAAGTKRGIVVLSSVVMAAALYLEGEAVNLLNLNFTPEAEATIVALIVGGIMYAIGNVPTLLRKMGWERTAAAVESATADGEIDTTEGKSILAAAAMDYYERTDPQL